MPTLDELKSKIEGEKKQKKAAEKEQEKPVESIDTEQVEKIVERMKKKYKEEGISYEEPSGKLSELKEIVAEGSQVTVNIQPVEELKEFKSPVVRQLGQVYMTFKAAFEPIVNFINKLPIATEVRYYLFSANMKYSLKQWLALSVSAAAVTGAFVFLMLAAASVLFEVDIAFMPITAGVASAFVLAVMLVLPRNQAEKRGNQLSVELPFALRQMAAELKAGIGLYKTIQTISTSDYGVLSEEFGRTITEIEQGTDTKEALRHFALRSQSKALRNALFHLIRALKTGGNLSDVMNDIAEDVSFELRIKISDFSEKMNFFGVIYIFVAIVIPVFIAILGTITNAPLATFGTFAMPPLIIATVYVALFPGMLLILMLYLKTIEPRV